MYAGSGHLYMLPVGKAGDVMPTFRPPGGMQRQERLQLIPGQADPRRGPHARASPRTAPATGGCHTTEQSAPAAGGAVWPWRAQGDQDAGGVEDQSAAQSQQAGSLGYPASRIAPQAGAALGDGQAEAARGQRDVCSVSLDEREGNAEPVLTVPGGLELGRVTSTPGRPGAASGQPCGEVRRPQPSSTTSRPRTSPGTPSCSSGTLRCPM